MNTRRLAFGTLILVIALLTPPAFLGQTHILPGVGNGLSVARNYAYVTASYEGLRIIDVSNPVAPTRHGFYDRQGSPHDVALTRNLVFVSGGSGGLVILRFLPHQFYAPLLLRNDQEPRTGRRAGLRSSLIN